MLYQINNEDILDLHEFIETLPHSLRLEVSLFVFEKTFKQIDFLKERPVSFIAWICPLLKPLLMTRDTYVYFEGDEITCIYFLKKGPAGYVLPRFNNQIYIKLLQGQHFGISCIVGSFIESGNFHIDNWIQRRDLLRRQFTVQT